MLRLLPLLLLACPGNTDLPDTADTGEDREATILALTGDPVAGADIYAGWCGSCHGGYGEGDIGPALATTASAMTYAEVVDIVLNGQDSTEFDGKMLPATTLQDQQVADVAQYVVDTF